MQSRKIRTATKTTIIVVFILVSMLPLIAVKVRAEEFPVYGPLVLDEPIMPGHTEGTGTHFELNDSAYLNVTLDSSEPISLILESVPETVSMHIEAFSEADYCVISLGGFRPQTTYYKYEDDYSNLAIFTTDENGAYSYTQDLTRTHYAFIQTKASTKIIKDDATGGDATSIGTWDNVTKTCKLMMDVNETIQISSNGIILDGNGHTVDGGGLTHGIYLNGRSDVTVKNLIVRNFTTGIYFHLPTRGSVTNNTVLDDTLYGISLYGAQNSTVTHNISPIGGYGIYIFGWSIYNTIINNNISSNSHGICVFRSSQSIIAYNNASNNEGGYGILISSGQNNIITKNIASGNKWGIYLARSSNNTVTDNIAHWNALYGFAVGGGSGNTVAMNTASWNNRGIALSGDSGPQINSYNIITCNNFCFNNEHGVSTSIIFNNTITSNNASSNGIAGIQLSQSVGNNVSDNKSWNNMYGILLGSHSNNNTVASNIFNLNSRGIYAGLYSDYNNIMGNTVDSNLFGIYLYYSFNNTIYNNNFINNPTQAHAIPSYNDNVFNLPAPIGGNHWSDWTMPDTDGDGFVDYPYVFTNGQDNLPWARESGWADKTPPTIAITTPQPYGLYTLGVELDFSATDDESGVETLVGQLINTAGEYQEVDSGFTPQPGVYTLSVAATDNTGNTAESEPVFFVVYDPEGGFATGGGWIYPDVESTLPGGKANFGFVAKYKQGSSTGNLEFQYNDADINLKSTTIDWLVMSDVSAQFQGIATINGEGIYTFRVLVKDNDEPGIGSDEFNIKIWQGTDSEADPIHNAKNIIAGGNIVIHK